MSSVALIIGFWTILFISNALLKVRVCCSGQWVNGPWIDIELTQKIDVERGLLDLERSKSKQHYYHLQDDNVTSNNNYKVYFHCSSDDIIFFSINHYS